MKKQIYTCSPQLVEIQLDLSGEILQTSPNVNGNTIEDMLAGDDYNYDVEW